MNLLLFNVLDEYLFCFSREILLFVDGTTGFVSVLSGVILVHGVNLSYYLSIFFSLFES